MVRLVWELEGQAMVLLVENGGLGRMKSVMFAKEVKCEMWSYYSCIVVTAYKGGVMMMRQSGVIVGAGGGGYSGFDIYDMRYWLLSDMYYVWLYRCSDTRW